MHTRSYFLKNPVMKTSQFHLATVKETPADAEIVSHRLMLRSGMIRRIASGIYSWSPLGLRVLRKVEHIVREEMNRAGAMEMLMPAIQPEELWHETGRWDDFGPQLLKVTDRAQRKFVYGPTHEEVITDFARHEIRSYKQLPLCFYQIQTKFRDEIRPRFGVMRSREFLMKDAYSFHLDAEDMADTYQNMFRAYTKIFTRLGLSFRAVEADSGAIGGAESHEFHVLAASGEDALAVSDISDYASNVEKAEAVALTSIKSNATPDLTEIATPGQHSIEDICSFLNITAETTVKTLIVEGTDDTVVALVIRGDHQLNEVKAAAHPRVTSPLVLASDTRVQKYCNAPVGSIGPVNLAIPCIVDRSAAALENFVCGANSSGKHFISAQWQRDAQITEIADLRNVVEGDPSPDGKGKLSLIRGIEVGHIFSLGTKYSESMDAGVLNERGKKQAMHMGCYGIGVSRIVAAAIEQNFDARGIIWPQSMAPFTLALLPMNRHKSIRVAEAADQLYVQLIDAGFDVLYDDRKIRPGVMFAEMELIGIPHRIVLGERGLDQGILEYQHRRDTDSIEIKADTVVEFLNNKFSNP